MQKILAGLAALVCLQVVASAEEDKPAEEIVVTGRASLLLLRHELVRAEDHFFDRYNLLNDDDRYDIVCKDERPIGSRIPVRECKARIIRETESEETQKQLLLGSPGTPTSRATTSKHYRILDEKLKAFATSDDELQQALMNYDKLSKKFAEEREKNFD